MNKFIVTTSINKPTKAIRIFDSLKDWKLIVVGDKKTPKNYKLKNGIYLTTKDQVKIDKELSNLIGWNCIERRNFGFIFAKKLGAKIVATVDDDNIPLKNWGQNLLINKKTNVKKINIHDDVFDPLFPTNYKNLWHRGFPLDRIDNRSIKSITSEIITPKIQADFWNGDPDIDCIARVMFKPSCKFNNKYFPFFSTKISPFNTQNTFIDASLLKDYFLFPGVGRMHDIWASYYLQYKKKVKIVYGKPSVFQERNIHTTQKDLIDEFVGIKKNNNFINQIINKNFKLKNFFSKSSIESFKLYRKHFQI